MTSLRARGNGECHRLVAAAGGRAGCWRDPERLFDAFEGIDETPNVQAPAGVGKLERVAPREIPDGLGQIARVGHLRVLDQHGYDPGRPSERMLDLDAQVVVG